MDGRTGGRIERQAGKDGLDTYFDRWIDKIDR